jgi:hypothetical protein
MSIRHVEIGFRIRWILGSKVPQSINFQKSFGSRKLVGTFLPFSLTNACELTFDD